MGCIGVKKTMRHLFLDQLDEIGMIDDPVDLHHLSRVLRMKEGEEVSLAYEGKIYHGTLKQVEKKRALFEIGDEVHIKPYPKITLYQGLAKGQKLESVLQHGTELGISSFGLVRTDHADVPSVEKKKERYLRILKDAAKQSQAPKIPDLHFYSSIEELPLVEKEIFFCYEKEDSEKISVKDFQDVAILVGPEGGFSEEEAHYLQNKAKAVTLGQRILRTETAGLVAASIILREFGVL